MLRIVSLIASATEIVDALELTPFLVGRSHECDFPERVRSLPVCTEPTFPVNGTSAEIDRLVKDRLTASASIYSVFSDVLERLQPTHIVTQTQCRVCAVSLEDVESALARDVTSRPKIIALEPNALEDIWADIERVAVGCGIPERGTKLIAGLQGRMDEIRVKAKTGQKKPRVACIEWLDPLMAAGNWVPELVDQANGENLFGEAGRHSPWMTWDQLLNADPDVIVSMPCGFDLQRTESEMHWLAEHPSWTGLRAVRTGQVYIADGNQYMNRPGPRVVESLQILAEILHPAVFSPLLEGVGWKRVSG